MIPLVLSGYMATGKSTLGRDCAARLGRPFVDLDAVIAAGAGCSIDELFRTRGETAFRALERDALFVALADPRAVVAVGGGALLDRAVRLRVLECARVVRLLASAAEIVRRLSANEARPLLGPSPSLERVQGLLALRESSYAECHVAVDTEAHDAAEVAAEICAAAQGRLVAVAAGERSYSVRVGSEVAAAALRAAPSSATSEFLVTDQNVGSLYADQVAGWVSNGNVFRHVLVPGEEAKTLDGMHALWSTAASHGLDRHTRVVALGGGVVSDMAGFFAATWLRGVQWAVLPTSLLAMVDASVGGKTGVDFFEMKNAVGAFWQPRFVVCDTSFLRTEPERGFRSGLSEVVKSALIGDPELLALLEAEGPKLLTKDPELLAEVVYRCVAVKARIVSQDPHESGVRAILNFGHTVGHALEAHTKFSQFTHGEAVSLGMVAALRLGVALGHTPASLAQRVRSLLEALGLPVEVAPELLSASLSLLQRDKKRRGSNIRFVFAQDVGHVTTLDLPMEELQSALVTSIT